MAFFGIAYTELLHNWGHHNASLPLAIPHLYLFEQLLTNSDPGLHSLIEVLWDTQISSMPATRHHETQSHNYAFLRSTKIRNCCVLCSITFYASCHTANVIFEHPAKATLGVQQHCFLYPLQRPRMTLATTSQQPPKVLCPGNYHSSEVFPSLGYWGNDRICPFLKNFLLISH